MIGRLYYLADSSATSTGAQDLAYVTATSAQLLFIERAAISQSTQGTSEQYDGYLRSYTIAPSGGDAAEVTPADTTDVAKSFTAQIDGAISVTTGSGTATTYYLQGFNCLSGFLWTPANDDEIIVMQPSGNMGLGIATSGTTLIWNLHMTIRELGT